MVTTPLSSGSRPRRRGQLAHINPQVLAWARTSLGLTIEEAAERLRLQVETLEAWERGDAKPTIPQLRKVATKYRRSLPVFFMPSPPTDWGPPRDWRQLPGQPPPRPSPELRVAYRMAQYRRAVALELEPNPEPSPLVGVVATRPPADELAATARFILGVTLDEQGSWKDRYAALNGWKNALEEAGALMFHFVDVKVREVRGFSFCEAEYPIIGVNGHDSVYGRVFTLAHELGHLMLGQDGSCDLGDATSPRAPRSRTEVYCNRFAGALLVPADALLADPIVSRATRGRSWESHDLDRLASRFRVSREVVLRRLLTLGKASAAEYRRHRAYLLTLPTEDERQSGKGSGGPPVAVMAIRDSGKTFARMVVDAYRSDTISGADVSDYLGVGLRHLPDIEARLLGPDVLTGGAE